LGRRGEVLEKKGRPTNGECWLPHLPNEGVYSSGEEKRGIERSNRKEKSLQATKKKRGGKFFYGEGNKTPRSFLCVGRGEYGSGQRKPA